MLFAVAEDNGSSPPSLASNVSSRYPRISPCRGGMIKLTSCRPSRQLQPLPTAASAKLSALYLPVPCSRIIRPRHLIVLRQPLSSDAEVSPGDDEASSSTLLTLDPTRQGNGSQWTRRTHPEAEDGRFLTVTCHKFHRRHCHDPLTHHNEPIWDASRTQPPTKPTRPTI